MTRNELVCVRCLHVGARVRKGVRALPSFWAIVSITVALLFSAGPRAAAVVEETEQLSQAREESDVDLAYRIELAGDCLLNWLNPNQHYLPTGGWSVAHDLGRWWDAILRIEDAIDYPIPAYLEGAMLQNLDRFTSGPDHLLQIPPSLEGIDTHFEMHSIREGMLALNALVRFRDSAWARERGRLYLETLDGITRSDGALDPRSLDYYRYAEKEWGDLAQSPEAGGDFTGTTGRAIEALVWYYEATGDALALRIASRFAAYHYEHTVNPDGSMPAHLIDPTNIGHDHSYMGTLRGLVRYGLLTGQSKYVEAVAATYRKALPEHVIKESGWAPHDLGKLRFPNGHGEPVADPASAADAAQLGLWLALEGGYPELLDDVERLVRARLLPAQMTPEDRKRYPDRTIGSRVMGGWGIHSLPHAAKGAILDVVAAVSHSLCDIYLHTAVRDERGLIVNLHFSYEDDNVSVRSVRDDKERLTVIPRVRDNVLIRIPGWAPPDSLRLSVNDETAPWKQVGTFALVSREVVRPGCRIEFSYALPVRYTREVMNSGREFVFKWKGDSIEGVYPQEEPYPFYPALSPDEIPEEL